jgi:exopolyphosphatase/pppGpp-phosphohydrolase
MEEHRIGETMLNGVELSPEAQERLLQAYRRFAAAMRELLEDGEEDVLATLNSWRNAEVDRRWKI